MSSKHFPRRGDRVNDIRRVPYANGFVFRVLYDDGPSEVMVKFDDKIETYDYGDFNCTWTDNYGGVFKLANDPKAVAKDG